MISAQMVKELREVTGAGMMDCKKALVETNGNMDEAVKWLREKGIMKAQKKESRIAAEGVCKFIVDGNQAVIYEVNSETDFVAKNEKFQAIVEKIGRAILAAKATCDECALAAPCGEGTVKDEIINATAMIGEKISLRRVHYIEKTDSQVFGGYIHMGGKIAVIDVLEGGNEVVAKDICMHVAAMNPKFLNSDAVDPKYLAEETEVLRQETLNEGKPAAIVDKIVAGKVQKMLKQVCLVDQMFVKNPDITVEAYAKGAGAKILSYIRLEVGEGIEKRQDDFAAEVAAAVAAAK